MPICLVPCLLASWLLSVGGVPAAAPNAARWPVPQLAGTRPADCVKVRSPGRLNENMPFSLPLPRQLEFRLKQEGQLGWRIRVGPQNDSPVDYMWVVSPPFQTSPHLSIGPVYGLTARESTGLERELRFVLTSDDYQKALAVVTRRPMDVEEVRSLPAQLLTGTLVLNVTGFATREAVDEKGTKFEVLAWITFEGDACVPR